MFKFGRNLSRPQHPSSRECDEEDAFLTAPTLFTHGPWVLIVVSALITAGFFAAGNWRITEGRVGAYTAVFQQAKVTANSTEESLSQLMARLEQTTAAVRAATQGEAPNARLRAVFEQGLGLRDLGVEVLALTDEGKVLAATPASAPVLPFLDTGKSGISVRSSAEGPTSAGLVFIDTPASRAEGPTLVYQLGPQYLQSLANKLYGDHEGWVGLSDRSTGALIAFATSENGRAFRAQELQPVYAMGDAVAPPLLATELGSRALERSLAAKARGTRGVTVAAGVSEAHALQEFAGRVSATWAIASVAGLFVMGLAALTSFALRKFAAKESYLRKLATVDILTGLPNRRSFQRLLPKTLAAAAKKGHGVALLFLDLDNFKYVNDSMGHGAGDALLRHVAQVLSATLRNDAQVCRLGGDEFTVILTNCGTPSEAKAVGARVLAALHRPVVIQDIELQTKASIGVALAPLHSSISEDLVKFADTAMYRAKQVGKGCCVVFDRGIAAQGMSKAKAVRELAQAIAQDELFLVYQPKFCANTGVLTGHEALVRWQHSLKGTVYPNDFIPLAEESGLIEDLGAWVLRRAVKQLKDWRDQGTGWHRVAVNVSALQLRGHAFVSQVQAILREYAVPGECLQLELTESALAHDLAHANALLRELRAAGITIAIDDFGTGYSSLSALQQFDIDYLKVDRSFVMKMGTEAGDEICRAIVSLGHALRMRVIAEGVETESQRSALQALGCDEIQGYLLSKPVAASEAVRFREPLAVAAPRVPTMRLVARAA